MSYKSESKTKVIKKFKIGNILSFSNALSRHLNMNLPKGNVSKKVVGEEILNFIIKQRSILTWENLIELIYKNNKPEETLKVLNEYINEDIFNIVAREYKMLKEAEAKAEAAEAAAEEAKSSRSSVQETFTPYIINVRPDMRIIGHLRGRDQHSKWTQNDENFALFKNKQYYDSLLERFEILKKKISQMNMQDESPKQSSFSPPTTAMSMNDNFFASVLGEDESTQVSDIDQEIQSLIIDHSLFPHQYYPGGIEYLQIDNSNMNYILTQLKNKRIPKKILQGSNRPWANANISLGGVKKYRKRKKRKTHKKSHKKNKRSNRNTKRKRVGRKKSSKRRKRAGRKKSSKRKK